MTDSDEEEMKTIDRSYGSYQKPNDILEKEKENREQQIQLVGAIVDAMNRKMRVNYHCYFWCACIYLLILVMCFGILSYAMGFSWDTMSKL